MRNDRPQHNIIGKVSLPVVSIHNIATNDSDSSEVSASMSSLSLSMTKFSLTFFSNRNHQTVISWMKKAYAIIRKCRK